MRHATVGAFVATSLLLGLAATAAAQGTTPPKPADKVPEKKEAPPAKAPEKAPAAPGKPFKEWDRLTGDWGGKRTDWMEKGIDVNLRLTDDFTRVQRGSADPYSSSNRYWIDANVDLDIGKLAKFKPGGHLFMSFWQFGGENGSSDFGGINKISSIDSEFRQELAELYFTGKYVKDSFDTRIGKMDPTERFNHSEYSDDFMNEAATYPATYFPSPYRPETAVGGDLFYRNKGFYAGLGIFDGSKQEGVETGHGGASHFFGEPGDLYWVIESGYRWVGGNRPARVVAGYWRHSGDFISLAGNKFDGSSGWYLMAEGQLTRENKADAKDPRGFYLVARYGTQEPHTSVIDWTSTFAVVRKGTFASRKDDSYGLAYSISSVTEEDPSTVRHSSEEVTELYYRAQITPAVSISPNVQYVGNPGATFRDAIVFGFRVVIDF
jgi:porin